MRNDAKVLPTPKKKKKKKARNLPLFSHPAIIQASKVGRRWGEKGDRRKGGGGGADF